MEISPPSVAPLAGSGLEIQSIDGSAFAGSSVNVVANARQAVLRRGTTRFAAYYDADAFLVLASQEGDREWTTQRSNFRGNVADAHNSISIGMAADGRLHVSWDQHNNPLNYARTLAADSLELGPKERMIPGHEEKVTYPQFYSLPSGDLLFLFREGSSGKGDLVLHRYVVSEDKWHLVHARLVTGEGRRSPYWGMDVDARGTLHLAWIWRDGPEVETNHDIAYAQSSDGGLTWSRSDGSAYGLPITHESCEYAARIAPGSHLMNSPFVATNAACEPFIATYWSNELGRPPNFRILRRTAAGWLATEVACSIEPFELRGKGTRRPPVSRPILLIERGAGEAAPVHLVYRSDRDQAIMMSSSRSDRMDEWVSRSLLVGDLGGWEPAYDPESWSQNQELLMLVQAVTQIDGQDRQAAHVPPTPIRAAVWRPAGQSSTD